MNKYQSTLITEIGEKSQKELKNPFLASLLQSCKTFLEEKNLHLFSYQINDIK